MRGIDQSFAWLHLSDFHQGLDAQGWLWPNLREKFREDLALLHDVSGPWDAVFFTGDLTQRADAGEFQAFSDEMARLWEWLRALGSDPVLLAVPGNHDLVRPDPRRPEVKLLGRYADDAEVRDELWRNPASSYRQVIDAAFANYTTWSASHPLPRPAVTRAGLLPGDMAASLESGGLRIGVVGLNTAFLQLGAGDHLGKLALDARQIHAACDGDPPEWCAKHDLCLLLTHHGPQWLAPAARHELHGEIAPPGRFAAHLFGHMHEGRGETLSVGGAHPWRSWQAASLFGLEQAGGDVQRRHGHCAGRLGLEAGRAAFRLWPRLAHRRAEGFWEIAPDHEHFTLEPDQGTWSEELRLPRRAASSSRPAASHRSPSPSPSPDLLPGSGRSDATPRRVTDLAALVRAAEEPRASTRMAWLVQVAGALAAVAVVGMAARQVNPPSLNANLRREIAPQAAPGDGGARAGPSWSSPGIEPVDPAVIDQEAQAIWREQYRLARELRASLSASPEEAVARQARLDRQSALVARFQRLRALLAESALLPGQDSYGYTAVRSDVTEFFEQRDGHRPGGDERFWELARSEEKVSLIDWSNPDVEPSIPRVTDRRWDYLDGKLRPRARIERFLLHPAQALEPQWSVFETAALPMIGYEGAALEARWFRVDRAWAEASRGSLVIETQRTGTTADCLRLIYYFGTEVTTQPVERAFRLYLGGEVPAGAWPRIAVEALPPRTGFRPDPASYRVLDRGDCKPLAGPAWLAAAGDVLRADASASTSTSGWRCEGRFTASRADGGGRSPVFLAYVEPPFEGCRSIEATRRAVHTALGVDGPGRGKEGATNPSRPR